MLELVADIDVKTNKSGKMPYLIDKHPYDGSFIKQTFILLNYVRLTLHKNYHRYVFFNFIFNSKTIFKIVR